MLNTPTRLRAVILHVPCRPPAAFKPDSVAIVRVWGAVHGLLDELRDPSLRRCDTITEPARQTKLKPQLDGSLLERVLS